ncbi:MAG TPA: lycopene cyclase family protein [Pseudonocardia sp.]|uniref:lycopene cyclase family protein n=1 Tax=Pseudonocardia sp. TaxID=60912 RepID=UPI002F413AE4
MLDVLVVGAGPAGRSVAAACAERGLRTELLDPAPGRPWRATYGGWHDELPATLPPQVIAASARGRAIARTEHDLGRDYAVLDTAELRGHLDARLRHAGVAVRRGLARAGEVPAAAVVLDAGGAAQPLAAGPHGTGVAAEQTAAGVVVPATSAAPLVAPGQALFMDWRPVNDAPGLSFLYAVPVGPGEVLLEETSLARRPGLDLAVLTRRLHTRLDRHGIRVPGTARREVVRFPLDRPRHRGRQALGFGAAAPLTHPATGYQLATALRLAAPVADAIATGLARGPAQAAHAVDAVLWPPGARLTHQLRRRGLECLLRLAPERLPDFFEGFFRLSDQHQRAYLGARTDPFGTAAAMAALFHTTSWPLRLRLIGSSLLVNAPPKSPAPVAVL